MFLTVFSQRRKQHVIGMFAISAGLLSTNPAKAHTDALAPTYRFGQIVINEALAMASYGPMREIAKNCSTSQLKCVDAGFAVIALPRSCRNFQSLGLTLTDGRSLIPLGSVLYADRSTPTKVYLFYVSSKPNVVYGATKTRGVQFMMIAILSQSSSLDPILKAHSVRSRQKAFDQNRRYLLSAARDQKMFMCH